METAERNRDRAGDRLVRAARNRDAMARLHLAQVEAEESGRTGDWREPNYHLYLSAEQGVGAAQRNSGEAYIEGTGREKDMTTGLFWLATARAARAFAAFEKSEPPEFIAQIKRSAEALTTSAQQ